jgi:hypothetical protein
VNVWFKLPVTTWPKSRSPAVDVASGPLSTAVEVVVPEFPMLVASIGFTVATPEYSATITCRFAAWLTVTVIVSAPEAFDDVHHICSPIWSAVNAVVDRFVAGANVLPRVSVIDDTVEPTEFVPIATRMRSEAVRGDVNPTEYVRTDVPGVPEFVWTNPACARSAEIKISRPTKMRFLANLAILNFLLCRTFPVASLHDWSQSVAGCSPRFRIVG